MSQFRIPFILGGVLLASLFPAQAGVLDLDGNGDYVTFPNEGIPSGSDPFTIEAWINPTTIPNGGGNGGQITFWGTQGPTNTANGFRLRGGSGTRHYFWGNDHDENFGIDILPDTTGDGGWHHLAVSYNGSQTQWYWNGAPLGPARNAGGVNVANTNHRIGSRLDAEYFHGLIDEVRIWDKARSSGEIAGDYTTSLSGTEANLVAYFDFEGNFDDRAGGDNDGSPVGNASIDVGENAPIGNGGGPVIENYTTTETARFEGQSATLSWSVDPDEVEGSLVVEILDDSDTVINSSSEEVGNFIVTIGDTGGTAQTWTYTLRARETGGTMISREDTVDIAVDPGVPTASGQSLQTVTTAPLAITLAGSDPNNHPNASPDFVVVDQPGGGSLSGTAPNVTYTADGGFTGSDSFTYRTNDGKYDSPLATISIQIVPAPSPPNDIALSTTDIGDRVLSGEFIATISTTDPNPGDTHSYSLVAGAGDTDNGSFSIIGNQLRADTNFTGLEGTSYSIRLRTQDNGGLSYEEVFLLTVVEVSDAVVINEIHFNPPENIVRQEFIELHNPSDTPADLSGWRLSGAADFVFPNGTTISAGGYLVVAEDPATLQSTLNATAIGPFSGGLNSEGEDVRLRDANDNIIDEVDYKVGFPWPVASDGGGASIELINPTLDNSLGSSWRASVPQALLGEATLLPLADGGWSWRPGETEASNPVDDWRDEGFVEDGSWNPNVQSPIGYGTVNGVTLNTVISGMRNEYRCIFLRNTFEVATGEVPTQLRVNYTADDGIVVWINGVEVERKRFSGDPDIGDLASSTGTEGAIESKSIVNPGGFLHEGSNTIAVQVFNATEGSSDLGFDIEVVRPGQEDAVPIPSPGGKNTAFAENAAPNIRKVDHTPQQPTATDTVLITAKVTDPNGIHAVNLEYQVVTPGAYIPAKLPFDAPNIPTNQALADNPAYEDGWTTVVMDDNGTGGDALAGDDIFSAMLPAQDHRTLVRYRITVTDGLDLAARVPYVDDPSLNFAYFVYDGVPAYNGHPVEAMNSLPVYHVITRSPDWDECIAYNGADEISQGTQARFYYNWPATFVYDGIVYDNIRYRLRGANGRYHQRSKRSMRFRMNKGHYLQARDQFGKKYAKKWRTLTTGKCFGNRANLSFGLNEAVNMYLYNKLGLPSADTHWVHWRVIDDAAEAPDQWHGDFHGMYIIFETYDVRFLEAHDMEKGNLYKLINQTTDWAQQQRYQSAFAPADGSDHNTIESQLDGGDSAAYIGAHVNLEKYYLYHAFVEAIKHYDYWPSANKNMVYYFEPDYLPANDNKGKLWVLPWDTDATWGPTYNSGHDVVYNALFAASGGGADGNSTPELWPEYFNVMREIRDLLWQPDQVDGVLAEFSGFITPIEGADADRWKGAPASSGNYNGLSGAGTTSVAALVTDMRNFAFTGGNWPGGGVGAGGSAQTLDNLQASNGEGGRIPNTPTIGYTGSAGFPTNGLAFQSSGFSDPQGSGSFGAMEWRIAQITDEDAPAHDPAERFKLEWEASWESAEITTFTNTIAPPTVATRSGLTYRARVRHQDNTGRWSHWSAPLEFTTTLPDISDYLAGLVVTEVMYHPADPSAAEINAGFDDDDFFEYIELKNVGDTVLDLTDVRFTKGVDFDFLGAAITTLAPGEIVLVVKDLVAFEMRYGNGLPVAGEWQSSDKLDNGGEQLKLSFGAGDPIRDFIYDDSAPWPTAPDGTGVSLTLIDPDSVPDHALAASWRASSSSGGTPGTDDAGGTTYASWRDGIFGQGNPAGSGELDDPDFDGVVNLVEYSSGTDPLDASSAPATVGGVFTDGGEDYLTISYSRHTDRPDVTVGSQISTDLTNWESGAGVTAQVGAPVDNGDGTETITERSLTPIGVVSRQYLRAVVETQ